jgi:hypothetical protein
VDERTLSGPATGPRRWLRPRRLAVLLTVLAFLPAALRGTAPPPRPTGPSAEGPLEPRHVAVVVNEADPLSLPIGR